MIQTDQGYRTISDVFARSEMIEVLKTLSNFNLERTKAGARHVLTVPVVRGLADDPRMVAIASQFVGPAAVPFRATLFDKSPSANWLVVWHQDTALPLRERNDDSTWGPWSRKAGVLYAHAPAWALEQVVALRISLDDSLSTNGPLRVLPNTHFDGVYDQPRRVLHIEYAATVNLGHGIELVSGRRILLRGHWDLLRDSRHEGDEFPRDRRHRHVRVLPTCGESAKALHSRTCVFHPMSWIGFGKASIRIWMWRDTLAGWR